MRRFADVLNSGMAERGAVSGETERRVGRMDGGALVVRETFSAFVGRFIFLALRPCSPPSVSTALGEVAGGTDHVD
jgi:hypothetical protein